MAYDDQRYDDAEERRTRRKALLAEMDGGETGGPAPSAPSGATPGPPGGGPLPPSAPPPDVTGEYTTNVGGPPGGPMQTGPISQYPATPFQGNFQGFNPTTINVPPPDMLMQGTVNVPQPYQGGAVTFGNAAGQTISQKELYAPPAGSAAGAPGATTGGTTGGDPIVDLVTQWMATNNPQGHRDAQYWIDKIRSGGGIANAAYWQQRFLESPGGAGPTPPAGPIGGGTGGGGGINGPLSLSLDLPPQLAALFTSYNDLLRQQMQQNEALTGARRDALLRLMQQGSTPINTENDAVLRPAIDAYSLQRRRGATREREALAERAAFSGLNPGGQGSGAFEAGIQGINEGASEDIAGYAANLAVNELTQRRQLLLQAAQLADAIGARTEAQQLNAKLAEIDALLRQQQFGLSYSQLGQQQGQFEDRLGYDYASLLAQANRDALLYGLRG